MRPPFAFVLAACALFAGHASASLPTAGSTLIVQQRTDDGRILLTDRPVPGATTERRWTVPARAPAATPERGEGADATPFHAGVPRHIDTRWRSVDDDPERERIVRETLERERLQRQMQRVSWRPREAAAVRGSAGP